MTRKRADMSSVNFAAAGDNAISERKPKYTPAQMAKFSRTGRKSRRKGKKFERLVAGVLRAWTPEHDWQTTRNSGRTDIPGDVYCPDREISVVIECKHRKNWSVLDIIRNNKGYTDEMEKVLCEDWRPVCETHPRLLMFCFNEAGLWVSLRTWGYNVLNASLDGVPVRAVLSGPDGVLWHLLDQDEQGECRSVWPILFK